MDPIKGVETPEVKGTPTPDPAAGKAAAPAPAQSAAPAKPAEHPGQKFVPISVMHEERDRRQSAEAKYSELQAEVDNLKNMVNQYQQPQQQQPPQFPYQQQPQQQWSPYQAAPQPVKEQIDALWQEDIRKGFQAEMMAMMQYRDHVSSKVDQEADMLKSKAADFVNYESKVRSYIRGLPLDAQSQPNIVQAAYLMMRGQDTDNILKLREAELMKKYQGGAAAAGLGGTFGNPTPAADGNTLSNDEIIAAQAQGMTPEEYLKWR